MRLHTDFKYFRALKIINLKTMYNKFFSTFLMVLMIVVVISCQQPPKTESQMEN